MKSLLKYLKNYKKETVLAPLFKMLEASFELFIPLVMAQIIDVGIANHDGIYIRKMCIVMVVLGLVGLVCAVTAQYFSAKAATGFAAELRMALFTHIQKLSHKKMDTIGTSTLITRMTSDINQVQSGVNLVLRLFLRSPFIVLGAMVMAFTVDVKGALVFVVTIPVLSVIVFGIMLYTMPLYKNVQSHLDKVLLKTRENLTGARVIRAFNKQESEREEFEQQNQVLTDAQKFVGGISGLMNPLTYIVVNVATMALLYIGAVRVDSGILTQGEVVALVNYMSQILVELVKLASLIISISKAIACGNRIQNIFEVEPEKKDGEFVWGDGEEQSQIEFKNVSLTYEGNSAESLIDISFQVRKGQTIGIIGGTGSGKTSVVNLIPAFYEASKGCVFINGKNVNDYQKDDLRKKIGIVPQKAVLFKGTIEENLRWGNEDATAQEMWKALHLAQAVDFVDQKGAGLAFEITQEGKNLSGGQKQRLTIARALVRRPEILILDDSASALDFATDKALREALQNMNYSPTTFIVSQRTSSIRHADKILVMEDGRLVGEGTHNELLDTCDIYREIHDSQFEIPKEKEGAQGE